MDFRDSSEEASFRTEVRSFIEHELPDELRQRGAFADTFDLGEERSPAMQRWWSGLSGRGWQAPAWPKEYGGAALSIMEQFVFNEELAIARAPRLGGIAIGWAGPTLMLYGNDEQKAEHLPRILSGGEVWCQGFSEPGAGSDLLSLTTEARRDGGDYVINGGKMWTTSGTQADWMCLLANTSEGPVHKNKSLICVPMKEKGVNIARKLDKLGMRSSDTAQIFFEDVRVPQRNLIGKEGEGFTYQMLQFQEERLWGATAGLVAKERMIDDTIAYTGQRKAFGQAILDNQVVHFRLAELKTEVEMLRAITYRAAELMLRGEDVTMLASMAKLKSGRLSREISDACLQYYGGMGFMNETPISRSYRDTRLGSIGGGADEIMLSIICKHMGILPGKRNR
jgi:citronellyl-CoA dehydrogenase